MAVALRVSGFFHLLVWHRAECLHDQEYDEQGDSHRELRGAHIIECGGRVPRLQRHGLLESRMAAGNFYYGAQLWQILLHRLAATAAYRLRTGEADVRLQREAAHHQYHQHCEQQCADLYLRSFLSY